MFGAPEGFVTKYIHTVFLTQMLLKSLNIKVCYASSILSSP